METLLIIESRVSWEFPNNTFRLKAMRFVLIWCWGSLARFETFRAEEKNFFFVLLFKERRGSLSILGIAISGL